MLFKNGTAHGRENCFLNNCVNHHYLIASSLALVIETNYTHFYFTMTTKNIHALGFLSYNSVSLQDVWVFRLVFTMFDLLREFCKFRCNILAILNSALNLHIIYEANLTF